MNPEEVTAERRLRLLFEQLADLDADERAARVRRLDANDPGVQRLLQLLDAHDHATELLDELAFLRTRPPPARADSSFDAATAFAPHYTIERELDGGGMSRVFVGRDSKLGRKIVAKVLPPELGAEIGLARFQQEIRLAAQLRHPHIVPLLESGEAAGCLYYTMPYIEGESLRDRLRRDGSLPVPAALLVAAEIADALGYAHSRGVIHRDIKPGNVLLDSGHAVVTDFGIARALHDAAEVAVTRTAAVIGTPAYMSPEQASADDVDARTDVYSLGCVLHEMVYGVPLSRGAGAFTPTARASRVRVPARVGAIIARATAASPADRFASAEEMREALHAVAVPRISPRTVWAAAAAVIVLSLGAWGALRPRADHSFAGPQVVVRQATTRGDVTMAAITPGGAYFAFVTSDTSVLRIGDIEAGTQAAIDIGERMVRPPPWIIRHIAWNPDGTVLYYLGQTFQSVYAIEKFGPWRSVIAMPLLAGPPHVVPLAGYQQNMSGFAISRLDSSLAVWRLDSSLAVRRTPLSPTDRHHSIILHVRGARVDTIDVRVDIRKATIAFSPNGRWLAACGESRDHGDAWRLALIATNGTTQRLLDSAGVAPETCGVFWSPRGDSLYVWPKRPGAGLASYAIDDATGRALSPPIAFRLRTPPAGERTSFSLSGDGKRLAYVEHRLERYVARAELGAGTEAASRDAELGVRNASWPEMSPAGDRFAYILAGDSGSAIYTRELRGGEPRQLSREYREGISGVRWSDDATRIATLTRRDSQAVILVLDATGAEVMTVRPRHTVRDTSLFRPSFDWAARGTAMMYTTSNAAGRREVWLIDLVSTQERLLLGADDGFGSQRPSLPAWSPDGRSILYDSVGTLIVKDVVTGTKYNLPSSGRALDYCGVPETQPCERGTIVPVRWRVDGTLFSERLDRDGGTTLWRSKVNQSPTLYAHFGKECKLPSLDREARHAVCQVSRAESDVFVVTRP